jgi:3-phosphoshikimate 1-carboxyvinyltransferase
MSHVPDASTPIAAAGPRHQWVAPLAGGPTEATVRLPGSKSMTARALVLSAIAIGPSTLHHPLRARDTELMVAGLRALGCEVSTVDDELWVVRPRPLQGGSEIDVGLAGTVMRFLPPLAGLAEGEVRFDGDPYARRRPMRPLVEALRQLGVSVDASPTGGLPLTVHGTGAIAGGEVTIDASGSSQLVTGLLLAAPEFDAGITVRHVGAPVPSAPHLRMTVQMLRAAGAGVDDGTPDLWVVQPGRLIARSWTIEPDLSGAAPFLAAALVTSGAVTVPGWPHSTAQPGDQLRSLLTRMGGHCVLTADGLTVRGTGTIRGIDADLSEVGELTAVIAALAVLADSPSRLRGIGHVRGHETDRLAALATELGKLGAQVIERPDGLEIEPKPLHGSTFQTYDDHRMAHAAAVIGLVVAGVELTDVACTSKTMPDFPALWESIAGHPAAAA